MTSSFWFRVGQYSEIDIIEHIGNPSNLKRQEDLPYEFGTNTHYYGAKSGPQPKGTKWRMPNRGRDDFHVYGMWWKADGKELIFYHNGEEINRLEPRVPLKENLKLIFDTEVFPFATAGVANIGLPLPENLKDNSKNTMLIDWIRTYKLAKGKDTREHITPKPKEKSVVTNGIYSIKSPIKEQCLLSRKLEKFSALMTNYGDWNDQKWDIQHLGDNVYTIQNHGNKRYLQIENNNCANGINAVSGDFTGKNSQKWKIVKNDTEFSIISAECSELAVDRDKGVKNANVHLWNFNAENNNQKWKLVKLD